MGFGSRSSAVSHENPTKMDNIIKDKIINRHTRMALNLSSVNILPSKKRICGNVTEKYTRNENSDRYETKFVDFKKLPL